MVDVRKTIVTALKTVSNNVYFELDVETPTLPCITYKVIEDTQTHKGTTLLYSSVTFQIKVWSLSVSDIASKTVAIDTALRAIGLNRTYYTELTANEVIQGVMQYQGIVREYLSTGGNN